MQSSVSVFVPWVDSTIQSGVDVERSLTLPLRLNISFASSNNTGGAAYTWTNLNPSPADGNSENPSNKDSEASSNQESEYSAEAECSSTYPYPAGDASRQSRCNTTDEVSIGVQAASVTKARVSVTILNWEKKFLGLHIFAL